MCIIIDTHNIRSFGPDPIITLGPSLYEFNIFALTYHSKSLVLLLCFGVKPLFLLCLTLCVCVCVCYASECTSPSAPMPMRMLLSVCRAVQCCLYCDVWLLCFVKCDVMCMLCCVLLWCAWVIGCAEWCVLECLGVIITLVFALGLIERYVCA